MATVFDELTEADILAQIVAPDEANLPEASARALLTLRFNAEATRRMSDLAQRNGHSGLTPEEQRLLERYQRVGNFLNLIQAKARLSLAKSAGK